MLNEITLGKWEDWLPKVEAQSVRLALLDMPYSFTDCKWDAKPVNLLELWEALKRVISLNGSLVFTSNQPFTTDLISSNRAWFKYALVWNKANPSGHLDAKKRPLRQHEDILIFAPGKVTYNPIMRIGKLRVKGSSGKTPEGVFGVKKCVKTTNDTYYPTSIIEISGSDQSEKFHPTQKPVKLFDYLIRTYSNPNDTVLDCFAGSGTTAIAALNTDRNFICIEQDYEYWQKATKRLELARAQGRFNFDFDEAI